MQGTTDGAAQRVVPLEMGDTSPRHGAGAASTGLTHGAEPAPFNRTARLTPLRVIEGDRTAEEARAQMRPSLDESVAQIAEEGALIARFAAGDMRAAEALTQRLLPGVHRKAWRMLGDETEAEDVAQEAMLRFWRQAATWRSGEAKASTWLYRVTHNLCIDRIRRRRATTDIDDVPEPVDPVPAVLERLAAAEESRALAQAIGRLPWRQRDAILLRHFEGCSNPEIAERLECSVEAVESLLARARRQLAAWLREERE
ncbi:MAG: sigma-70 family RNA polymerase sigma factor [Pseudomonadota bacterium]